MKQAMTMSRAMAFFLALVAVLLAATVVVGAKPAHATTLTVTNTSDPGNGVCDASCTLREAINRANVLEGPDTITFDIPGTGVQTIEPASALPTITEQVTIAGYSQPGASPNTLPVGTNAKLRIELNGESAGIDAVGLGIEASNVVVRGLVINRFAHSGIWIFSGAGNRIEGNFVGTDPSGTQDRGNGFYGVAVQDSDNTVGGTTPAARNLISGNNTGVFIGAPVSNNNRVQGNLIGTKASGSGDLGNTFEGVYVSRDNNIVGGLTAAAANTIAFNTRGVTIDDVESTGNGILRNSIFSNDELGIDLGLTGPTPNDPKDPDSGPNNLQNKPVIGLAVTSGGQTTIKGKLNSTPNRTFRVEFFSDPSGNEGKKFLGSRSVSTNDNGNASFTFKPANKVAAGQNVTATATSGSGNTSEFSAPREVTTS